LTAANPYDEFPYRSRPIPWAAPETLCLTSMLHGGPRVALDAYRVLELGCGDGANLLPLAYYRRRSTFVGVDSSRGAISTANARRADLSLRNLEFVHSDFDAAAAHLEGPFDFVLAHGVFSWVTDEQRNALLELCKATLRPGGIVYLNYNARPGWNVRGMVREFLLAHTAASLDLRARTERAQEVARSTAAALAAADEHPYQRLMEREFRFVADNDPTYVAHEFLAPQNHAYWRREFLALTSRVGLDYVADADFNLSSGRTPRDLPNQIAKAGLVGQPVEDIADFLCYRQLHSPILTKDAPTRRPLRPHEFANLYLASCLVPLDVEGGFKFRHPSGFEVEAKEPAFQTALRQALLHWPRAFRIGELFADVGSVVDDLRLLHHHAMIEIRAAEPGMDSPPPGPLNDRERHWGGYCTSPYHTLEG
jgi:SAM-dependent methyltransferase